MRKTALSYVGDVVFLPFLYETRTILQLRRSGQIRPFSSTSSRCEEGIDESKPREQPKHSSFLKAKATASKASPRGSGKGGTTVTQAERGVFYDIFNQVAGKGPAKDTSTTRDKRDASVDHEEILAIFSSAVSSHVAEQKALAEKDASRPHASKDKLRALEDEEKILQRYPRSLRKLARRTTAAVIGLEEPKRRGGPGPRLVTEAAGESESVGKSKLKKSLKVEEAWTLDGLASSVVTNTVRSSKVPEEALPVQSSRIDQDQIDVQHNHANNGQTHLDEEFELSTGVGSVTPRTAQTQRHRPSFDADKNNKDVRPSMDPSFARSGEDVGKGYGSNGLPVQPTSLEPSFLRRKNNRSHFQSGLHPSILGTERRAEDIEKFSDDNCAIRPSLTSRAEDVDVAPEMLQHDPEAVFQTTVHRFCHKEMGKLADSFQKAMEVGGDVGIWNACLAKVFPMIKLLDASLRNEKLSQHKRVEAPIRDTPNRASKAGSVKTSISLSPAASALADLPHSVPPLYVISRIYPAAILLAFRLLRTNFPTSPLSLAILPQIRSLGPTSYVLGASSEFYNALIELRWDVYSDLKGIDGLLMEMERSGVEFDVGTWNTLVKIGGERFNDLHDADGGVRGTGFWERSHNVQWYQKVAVEWKLVIAARLREHGLGSEISEREYGTTAMPETGQASAEQTVWL